MSNNQSPRRNSNPFSERISSLLQLRQQIAQQQQALSEKIEQDLRRLDTITTAPQVRNNNSLRAILSEMDGVEIYDGSHEAQDIDMNNIELYCEPECPFNDESSGSESESTSGDDDIKLYDNDTSSSDEYELDSLSNKFAVSLDIYDAVSYNNFNLHKW
eukprot:CAMPEP_0201572192 /NCGR_PEP_ID=MMETSP0190_2-20130828/15325_1 /ASSEMBLY_ACC=CAM_ASM_000263 /TAXON_ID=37353 /ORGANISM="Rosalina sp." /LENGTH=158 /DNA_ID=CAMNT_0047997645 /DNA_START=76 /DNA_END=549 /DNA_ORIENTATION=+